MQEEYLSTSNLNGTLYAKEMPDFLNDIIKQSIAGNNPTPPANFRFVPLPQSYCIPSPLNPSKLPSISKSPQLQKNQSSSLLMPGDVLQMKRNSMNDYSNSMYPRKYGRYNN